MGDLVDYHSIIGGEVDSTHIVDAVDTDRAGQPVAWLKGKSGCVHCNSLTPARKCSAEEIYSSEIQQNNGSDNGTLSEPTGTRFVPISEDDAVAKKGVNMDPTKVMELLNDALSSGEKIDIEIGLYIGQLSERYGMEVVRRKLEETVKQDAFWDVIKVIDEALIPHYPGDDKDNDD